MLSDDIGEKNASILIGLFVEGKNWKISDMLKDYVHCPISLCRLQAKMRELGYEYDITYSNICSQYMARVRRTNSVGVVKEYGASAKFSTDALAFAAAQMIYDKFPVMYHD